MGDNVALNGTVRLKNGLPWRGQQDLEDLLLVRHTTDSTSCGQYIVSYTVESIIPLHSVKLYTLTNQRYRAYTNSTILHEYFCKVYQATSIFNQPKYAILVCVRNNGFDPENPFDDNEISYPLAKESYMVLFGQRLGQSQDTPGSLQVYGQVLRDKFDYMNFYTLSNTCGSTFIPTPLALDIGRNHDTAALVLDTYRPGHSSNETNQHKQQSWVSIFEKDMDRLQKMDKYKNETKRNRPERTLSFIKRKPFQLQTKGDSSSTTTPIKRSASASALSSPTISSAPELVLASTSTSTTLAPTTALESSSAASQPLTSVHIKKQQSLPNNKTKIFPPPSTSSSQPIVSDTSYYGTNRKQLKSAIWSKLLQDGHDKKSDDTIAFYHIIYQSMQYVLRKTFKTEPLEPRKIELLIDNHIQFYHGLDFGNDFVQ
ncbi:hypothetical protein BC941DRAFT_436898 [Chlamydoabsidia padenii]|nr:hypothetical protein BC941DRAFT_436898 [Chlamydoabsidia padenii]